MGKSSQTVTAQGQRIELNQYDSVKQIICESWKKTTFKTPLTKTLENYVDKMSLFRLTFEYHNSVLIKVKMQM